MIRVRIAATLSAALIALSFAPLPASASGTVAVVVTSRSAAQAAADVAAAGGRVDAALPIVDGVAAHVPAASLGWLSGVDTVAGDRPMSVTSADFGSTVTTAYPVETGATALWSQGDTGQGVSIALVDTGVADVPDLAQRVVASADVSGEGTGADGYGHGTFMAGLLAGDGSSSDGRYVGVAPGAGIVSIKVAASDGSTTLSRVLLGVQVAQASAVRFNTRVLLLALSSESPLPPDIDPLSIALRRAWASGIVVVVPAGNSGPDAGSISSPGEDPVLLTVGSVYDNGTGNPGDDLVSSWSGRGETRWGDPKPDVAAPGEHLVSLRAPGSAIDVANPGSVVDGSYFKGSGTSMAAAVAAGASALILSLRPELSPDAVKAMLTATASPVEGGDASSVGAGVIDAADAARIESPGDLPPAPGDVDEPTPGPNGAWTNGRGRQQWAGGRSPDDQAQAAKWASRQWASAGWDSRQWAGRQWAARQWAARQWAYEQWMARQWAGRQWNGRQWSGSSWSGRQWTGRQWSARQWQTEAWMARQWSGSTWSGRQWTQDEWLSRQWAARQWESRQWESRQWESRQWSSRQWESRQWSDASWT